MAKKLKIEKCRECNNVRMSFLNPDTRVFKCSEYSDINNDNRISDPNIIQPWCGLEDYADNKQIGWLRGWKSKNPEKHKRTICGYLQVSVDTAMKWYAIYGLPLRFIDNPVLTGIKTGKSIPRALPEEIDIWMSTFVKIQEKKTGRKYFPAWAVRRYLKDNK